MVFLSHKSHLQLITVFLIGALTLSSLAVGFMELPRTYYYGALFVFGAMLFFSGARPRIRMVQIVCFLFICTLSILVNDPPPLFKAWQRLLAFSLAIVIVSPMFDNEKINELRRLLFGSIMWICIILSVASFFCFFGGINFFTVSDEVLEIDSGTFSGLFSHSMLLGPIAGLSAIYSFSLYLGKGKLSFLMLLFTICCLGSVLFSASRSALASCVFGLAIALLMFYRGNLSRGLIVGIFIVCILALSFPLWENWIDYMAIKQQKNIDAGGLFASRRVLWSNRLSEIRHNPLTGVGFCCVDTKLTLVDTKTGAIEPGSSWLAIFSMTGVFGFISFLLIYISSFRQSFAISNRIESSILCGCLAFFGVHMLFEGYVLAVGSILGLLFWLLVGCVIATVSYSSASIST